MNMFGFKKKPDIIKACPDYKWRVFYDGFGKYYQYSILPENEKGWNRAEEAEAAYHKWMKFLSQKVISL